MTARMSACRLALALRDLVLPCSAMFRCSPLAALALVTLVACGGGSDDDADSPDAVSPSCMEATSHSDLAWIQEKVFTPSCAGFSACHMGSALEAEGLNLEPGQSHTQLINVDSTLFPQFKRVVPGDPQNSYLMIIMGQFSGPLGEGGTMPYNNPLLCKEKRDAVERWITMGAPAT